MSFNQPLWLLLLLLLPLFAFWLFKPTNGGASYSNVRLLTNLPTSFRQKCLWLPKICQLLALAATLVALAQPYTIEQRYAKQANGIAISLVVDISTSMNRQIHQSEKTRMEVANQVLQAFILGDGEKLQGRENDLISIVTFARYPDTISPLTSSYKTLAAMAEDITVTNRPNEDSTAYGDAVALAAAQLSQYEESVRLKSNTIKSKIIILLTDGENNSGQYDPLVAAAMAEEWGIKVYTISLGETSKGNLGKGTSISDQTTDSDWGLLAMAEVTGATFQRAHDLESLQKVYESIDQLEKSQLHDTLFEDQVPQFHYPVALALLAFFLSGLLNATWLRVAQAEVNRGESNA